jgi:hypothetical protein
MCTLVLKPAFITVKKLQELGYRLSGQQIPIGEKPCRYGILEILNEDNKKEVSFSLLFSTKSMNGIVLPQPFHFYKLQGKKQILALLLEYGI